MKIKQIFLPAAAVFLAAAATQAQDANSKIKVKVKDVKVEAQMTPDYAPRGVTEKRWKPKQWVELDTEIDVDLANDLGGKDGVFPGLEFKYFIGVNAKTKEGKTIVFTGTIQYVNVPASKAGDASHALAYVTPTTLKSALKKDNVGKADVAAIGLEIRAGSEVLAGGVYSNRGAPWWIDSNKQPDTTKFEFQDGAVLPKSQTPFAPLWADYDLQSKDK